MVAVTQSWQIHKNSKLSSPEPRDFKKMNKMSLRDGSVNARDVQKYRHNPQNDIKMHLETVPDRMIKIPIDSHAYGKETRPHTPFKGIINGNYGTAAHLQLNLKYAL